MASRGLRGFIALTLLSLAPLATSVGAASAPGSRCPEPVLTDVSGDQLSPAGPGTRPYLDIEALFFTLADSPTPRLMAHLVVHNLTAVDIDSNPRGAVIWEWGGSHRFVRASSGSIDLGLFFQYGTFNPTTQTFDVDGETPGRLHEGRHGVIEMDVPGAIGGNIGQTLANPYVLTYEGKSSQADTGIDDARNVGGDPVVVPVDRGPDTGTGTDFVVGDNPSAKSSPIFPGDCEKQEPMRPARGEASANADREIECFQLTGPSATRLAPADVELTVRVLLDGVPLEEGELTFARVRDAYLPLGITVRARFDRVSFPGGPQVVVEDLLAQAKAHFGGSRPPRTDLVHILTTKDLRYSDGDDLQGQADCIGGVQYADRAFSVSEKLEPDSVTFGPRQVERYITAVVTTHEIGHLLGAHHHYGNCVEGTLELPCTVMVVPGSFHSFNFSSINAAIVRGHAAKWAAP